MSDNFSFWMVHRENGGASTRRHLTFAEARDEAKRLAEKERGRFFILQALAVAEPESPPVRLSTLTARPEGLDLG